VNTAKRTQKQQCHAHTQNEPIFSFFTRHVLLFVGGGERRLVIEAPAFPHTFRFEWVFHAIAALEVSALIR
jgi:hypothetical protein